METLFYVFARADVVFHLLFGNDLCTHSMFKNNFISIHVFFFIYKREDPELPCTYVLGFDSYAIAGIHESLNY